DQLSRFQLLRKLRCPGLQKRYFHRSAHQQAKARDKLHFDAIEVTAVTILKIDDSNHSTATQDRNRKKRLEALLGKWIEKPEEWILVRVLSDADRLFLRAGLELQPLRGIR